PAPPPATPYLGEAGPWAFSKGLPKDAWGQPLPGPQQALAAGLAARDAAGLAAIPFTGVAGNALVNPAASFNLPITRDRRSADFALVPPPQVRGAVTAAELVELYWAALLRDIPWVDFDTSPLVAAACAELTSLKSFHGPRESDGRVSPRLLFKGTSRGAGDFGVSRLLQLDVPGGALTTQQWVTMSDPQPDTLTSVPDWLAWQGGVPGAAPPSTKIRVPITTGRHLATYVFRDFPVQPFLNAALILEGATRPGTHLPYAGGGGQAGFVTYGRSHLFSLLSRVTDAALRASWFYKWQVYRRIRPEEYAGRFHFARTAELPDEFPRWLKDTEAAQRIYLKFGNWLLPQVYPMGAPAHPAYPGGHAAIAGACATVLKAWYPEPCKITTGGPEISVADAVDQLADEVGMGRSLAGVHFRSDNVAGLQLGERVALAILAEDRLSLPEPCPPHQVRCLNGKIRPA
ncbi:MAG: vanadium-dependent haloperoxidase, partial [Angustibacter sp.]